MNCKIDIDEQGNVQVKGENSSLFIEALFVYGNDIDALNVYGVSLTDEFKETTLAPTVNNVLSFIESYNISNTSFFSEQEITDIYNSFNYQDFLDATTINGEFVLDRENMLSFYSPQEADDLLKDTQLTETVHKIWYKAQSSMEFLEEYDFKVPPTVIKTQEKTVLGKNRIENLDKTYVEIGAVASGISTLETLNEVFDTSDKEITNEIFPSEAIVEEYKNKQALQQYVENPLTGNIEKKVFNSTQNRLLQTFNPQQDFSSLTNNIDFLNRIDNDVLSTNTAPTTDILIQIEDLGADLNIDLVGLSETNKSIEETKDFLNSLKGFMQSPIENIENFSTTYNNFFNIEEETNRPIISDIQGEFLMKIETLSSEIEMFDKYSVIKITDNIYKKVKKTQTDIYEELYERVLQTPTIFDESIYYPFGFNKEDRFDITKFSNKKYKTQIKQKLKEAVEKEIKYYQTEESYSPDTISQLIIHKKVNNSKSEIPLVNKESYYNTFYEENTKGFEEKFVSDLNKFIIKQKLKGKNIPPLTFTQRGVELEYDGEYSAVQTLYSLPKSLQKNLLKYAQLTNNIPSVLNIVNFEKNIDIESDLNFNRNFYTNFKDQLPLFEGEYTTLSSTEIKANSTNDFIKLRDGVYEYDGAETYGKIEDQNSFKWNRNSPNKIKNQYPQTPNLNITQTKKIISTNTLKEEIDQCN